MGLLNCSPLRPVENEFAETEPSTEMATAERTVVGRGIAEQSTVEQLVSDAIRTAVGLPTVNHYPVEDNEECCHSKRPGRVLFEEEVNLHHLVDALRSFLKSSVRLLPAQRPSGSVTA